MVSENSPQEQDRKLEQMDYSPGEDIFNQEEHIPVDGDGNPIPDTVTDEDEIDKGLDIPGTEDDEVVDNNGLDDEENDYWSISDNDDNHEEENTDLIR
ncbi:MULTISPECIES: hypothetical protein [Chryseobacterium]|uniref:Uncharacterized protein n=1 Tax=Chryseobacterium camelliae TaxID=1265445 RepID=A0ABU0TEQ6_9FLAO|nr:MULTISPECIES: hypothetical protein [Chryseobacterium]MDT3406660.1 hypothetical protein [Pseudacidovorax intermedius]MDQ1095542.1 hypothetical protein [Chryseobacterium camelliae]MDQ1099480.1 hypothetical protein [Chryseobacterium sp. SORGH_AS_1048]MDR6086827.1 hypothetical protein [Chryseobacterium sp. SORGH_AS_0909]MDR6131198.1 hypothetical protein [Chryseobacterium sp. SORGH_AS_1175]